MADSAGPLNPRRLPDWSDLSAYDAMLSLDRRAWAWECLQRDPTFTLPAESIAPTEIHVVRSDPLLVIVKPPDPSPLKPWGLHFRPSDPGVRNRIRRLAR
jgi:hypothetical protein